MTLPASLKGSALNNQFLKVKHLNKKIDIFLIIHYLLLAIKWKHKPMKKYAYVLFIKLNLIFF